MIADLSALDCFFNASVPNDVFVCLSSAGSINSWGVIFVGLLLLFVVAFSFFTSISKGMMIGGFFMSMAGLALLALDLLNVGTWFLALLVCLAGLMISVINRSEDD